MSMKNTLIATIIGASLIAPSIGSANPLLGGQGGPGFVVLAEQRFDPAVQRYMAERSLRALPLHNGQLYYIYPQHTSTQYLEEMQIRFMQALISERNNSEPNNSESGSNAREQEIDATRSEDHAERSANSD